MSGKQVFLIGPGFIGREVLDRLLAEGYEVTTIVRRDEAVVELQQSGAKAMKGSLDDHDVIADQTFLSDVVIHTASADHPSSVQAVIKGIKKRAEQKKKTIYIHTSGTGVLDDGANGDFKSDKVYEDDKPEGIDALPDSAPHRAIDKSILEARKQLGESAKMVIILPPLIYGYNKKYGRLSIQMPTLTRFALKRGYVGHVGEGLAVWNQIHVFDLAQAYLFILHWLEQNHDAAELENPYFFCENGVEFSWKEGAAAIGDVLHKAGKLNSAAAATPKRIPQEEFDDLFGPLTPLVVGSNSRSRANRLRKLGWKPHEKALFDSLAEDEIPAILREKGHFDGQARVLA